MEINLSILIPTHNRPEQFKRCLKSVLVQLDILDTKNIEYNIEILVNNDSNDITEVYDNRVEIEYYYENTMINNIFPHEFLYAKAKKDWIYILEDDDTLNMNFLKFIYELNQIESNIIMGTYIPDNNIRLYFDYFKSWKKGYYKFAQTLNLFSYQFGQILFRNKIIDTLFDNKELHKYNDCIPLLQLINVQNKIYLTNQIFFTQYLDTINYSNISFNDDAGFFYKNFNINHNSYDFNLEKM